ncbi:MAG: hypothetical protein ACFFCT_05690 [Candidatus Odinarchaeota archaeon]
MRRLSSNIVLLSIVLLMFGSLIVSDSSAADFGKSNHFETSDVLIADDFGWKAVWDTVDNDTGYDIVMSNNGLLYVAGASGDDAILLKYNALGQQLWNRSWGGTGTVCATAVIVDDMNDIYSTGYTTSGSIGEADAFIAKYDQDGTIVWSRTWGGLGEDGAQGMCLSPSGDIYICGFYEDIVTSSTDIFVVSFDEDGNILSETILAAEGNQNASDILVSPTNTIYLAGTGQEYNATDYDMMFVALESNGSVRFTQFWGYSLDDSAHALELCTDGNILMTGHYSRPGWAAPYIEFGHNGSVVDALLLEPEEYEGGSFWGYDLLCTNDNNVYVVGKTPLGGRIFQAYRTWGYNLIFYPQATDVYFGITLSKFGEIYVVGEGTFDQSTRFIRIENFRQFEWYTSNEHIIDVWSYSGDGITTELTVGDFTGDEVEEVVVIFQTIEDLWVEVISSGSLLWSYFPEGNVTQLSVETAQFDSDPPSELLVRYRLANINETLLVALDSNGLFMWQWQGNLTEQEPILADLDADYFDEVCLELVDGIEVLESDSTVRWNIVGDANTTWTMHDSGDYDQDGQIDIVASKKSNATSPTTLECVVLDGDRNIIAQFPLLKTEAGLKPNSTGVALTIEIANFFGDEKLGFYYVTTDDDIHISEFIVNSMGEAIGYSSSLNEWRNKTWYESCTVIIYDFDNDTLCEILRMTPSCDIYLMDSYGRIIWINQAYPRLLWMPYGRNDNLLWDFDRDSRPDLVTVISSDYSQLEPVDNIYLVDPQTGNKRYITSGIWGRAQYITDIDNDSIVDILVLDVYRVKVVKYGQYSYYDPNYLITNLIIIGYVFSIIAVGTWFIYDYARGLAIDENFKE